MFKLQRPTTTIRPSKERERVDLKFSNFQALQVPKGWDRLFIFILSVETGKTIAKLGKALVKNGNCQWTEIVSESIFITRDHHDSSSNGYEECLLKLVVSTGSTRSSALGETTINVAHYVGSRAHVSTVSQPLKKCSYGTTLQVKLQCIVPRSKSSDEESKYPNSQEMGHNVDDEGDEKIDNGYKSKYSDDSIDSLVGLRSRDVTNTSDPHKSDNKETSKSESEPDNNSYHSLRNSIESSNESFTRKSNKSEEYNSYGRQREGSFETNSPVHYNYSVDEDYPSNQSSSNSRSYQREDSSQKKRTIKRSSINHNNNTGSSKSLLEAAEDTIEELRAEAKMWERNARKLMIDLDMSRREFQNLSKKHAELAMELKESQAENDGIKREVENLKRELHKLTMTKKNIEEDPDKQSDNANQMQKVLESEIKYHQDLSTSLRQQLRQSQESNVELVSVLQELEQTIEQQKIEIENLSSLKMEFKDLENSISRNSEDNSKLLAQIEQLQESEKKLQMDVQLLQRSLRGKSDGLENEKRSHSEILSRAEEDYKQKLSVKEEEILRLEAKLGKNGENDVDLMRELDFMREKVEELEKDCAELTDENLELILKLKDLDKSDIREFASFDTVSNGHSTVFPSNGSDLSDHKFQFLRLNEDTKNEVEKELHNSDFEGSECLQEIFKKFHMVFERLRKPWFSVSSEENVVSDGTFHDHSNASNGKKCDKTSVECILTSLLELNKLLESKISQGDQLIRDRESEIDERNATIDMIQKDIEEKVLQIRECENSKAKLQESYEVLLKELDQKKSQLDHVESSLMSKEQEFDLLAQDYRELETKVLEMRENKIDSEKNIELERNLEELQRQRNELGNTLSTSREENMKLQEIISGLEAQVRELKQEQDTCVKEMESQILDLQQKAEDMSKQCLGAQEQCEHVKLESKALQEYAKRFEHENEELRGLNTELNQENQELKKHQSLLVDQLNESKKDLSDRTEKIVILEDRLTMLREDFVESERRFQSEVDELIQENRNLFEKLALDESLHQAFSVKEREIETLQKEIQHLNTQIHEALKDNERKSMEYSGEVSRLIAEKEDLQVFLQELQTKFEIDLQESESKVRDLNDQLVSVQQNHEELLSEHQRVVKLLAHYKRSEEKWKTNGNDLELKMTICEYERQQLAKEIGQLKSQLQNISGLQDQISVLKSELEGCILEKRKLELALHNLSGDYEKMKAEKILSSEKIYSLQGTVDEFEECKRQYLDLKEKFRQMEDELAEKSILSAQNVDLKNELDELMSRNMQFQQRMYILEEEKDEYLKKAQALAENLKVMEERYNLLSEGSYNNDSQGESPLPVSQEHVRNHTLLERTKSSLEAELRDLRERYLEMSLKYAEVEAEREDLVMKLKASKSGKRWFS